MTVGTEHAVLLGVDELAVGVPAVTAVHTAFGDGGRGGGDVGDWRGAGYRGWVEDEFCLAGGWECDGSWRGGRFGTPDTGVGVGTVGTRALSIKLAVGVDVETLVTERTGREHLTRQGGVLVRDIYLHCDRQASRNSAERTWDLFA